ncbi:MAG: hypothetical protein CSA04_01225 [Bacteroidetes bacterium]|nr:MAG: hypothetical protein CSA04_01225 [Bacteroidota bacterium]
MKKDEIAETLCSSILLKNVEREKVNVIADICTVKYLKSGDTIFSRGEHSTSFYFVASGEVGLIVTQPSGAETIVGRILPGCHFGETALLLGKSHGLTSRTVGDTVLICMAPRYFHSILLKDNTIYQQLSLSLAERLLISFEGQKDNAERIIETGMSGRKLENFLYMPETDLNSIDESSPTSRKNARIAGQFSANMDPVLLTGKTGAGKKFFARQIHQRGSLADGPFIEIDLRDMNDETGPERLFGKPSDRVSYGAPYRSGVFEQFAHGTIVLLYIDCLSVSLQQKLYEFLKQKNFKREGCEQKILLDVKLIFVTNLELEVLQKQENIHPDFIALLQKQHYRVPALYEHKRDIPWLVEGFVKRYCREYGKGICQIPSDTMSLLMNYDWPGNLVELDTVIQRAVMLSQNNTISVDQIVLGLPKSEGRWVFNLLRIPAVKKFLNSEVFPLVPRFVVGLVLLFTLWALLFGSGDAERNIGSTISWAIGWPLLYFSFFFLARTWCSVCTLAVPGRVVQAIIKPKRSTPHFIEKYSGWIMASLCILVLWIELVWNAYSNPLLTAGIILAVSAGSFVFSIFFKRRVWCRYICPLGAINAIFAMPSLLEIRANKHFCLNRCREHVCYRGVESQEGCPMFRHPFLVDNNRDCIMCTECIKNCSHNTIQLNVRLTPEELWSLNTPRRADTFLVVALGAIFFPFALHDKYGSFVADAMKDLGGIFAVLPHYIPETVLFFSLIILFQIGYLLMVRIVSYYAQIDRARLSPMLAYGFIPLILGCYLAEYFGIFMEDAWRILPNFLELFGVHVNYIPKRLLSQDATEVLQAFTVGGGMLAAFYAIFRIMARFKGRDAFSSETLVLPYSFMVFLGGLSLYLV